jgi:hypothetical protein
MILNASICKFMDDTLSSFRRIGKYDINGVPLQHIDCIKMLGVYVAFNLSWKNHVDYIRVKCVKLLWIVDRNLKGCSSKIKCQAFQSLIRPIMNHAVPGSYPTTNENLVKLQKIQNRASRLIYGKNCSHELDKIYYRCNLYSIILISCNFINVEMQ